METYEIIHGVTTVLAGQTLSKQKEQCLLYHLEPCIEETQCHFISISEYGKKDRGSSFLNEEKER